MKKIPSDGTVRVGQLWSHSGETALVTCVRNDVGYAIFDGREHDTMDIRFMLDPDVTWVELVRDAEP